MYKIYEAYLDREFSVDYWSDEGITQAALILCKFTDRDWDTLAELCKTKSDEWAARCVETLGDEANEKAMAVLLNLLKSKNDGVRVTVLDTIRSFVSGGINVSACRNEIVEAIKQLREYENIGQVVTLALNSLDAKLLFVSNPV